MQLQTLPEVESIRAFNNVDAFCETSGITIRDQRGLTVPLRQTPAQKALSDLIAARRAKGVPPWIVYLKPRRVHVSVGACLHGFRQLSFLEGQHGACLSYRDDATRELYDYFDQFEKSYSPDVIGIRQLKVNSRRENEVIKWEGGGSCRFLTAGTNTPPGRGSSFRFLLLDEYAFSLKAERLMTALLQCVPDDPDTMILKVSTANGAAGAFYEDWQRIADPARAGQWCGFFFAWWQFPNYQRALEMDPQAFERSLIDFEHAERQKYNLTLEQLNWRRWAIVNKCEGDEQRFLQEYPGCAEEAFLTSGRPRFDQKRVALFIPQRDVSTYNLVRERVATADRIVAVPRLDGLGPLKIFRHPKPEHCYVIGADSVEGQDAGADAGRSDPDYMALQVLDQSTGEQAAVWRDRSTPTEGGRILFDLAWFYNWAFLNPEANNTGLALIAELLHLGYPQSLIYHRQRTPDNREPKTTSELGYKTLSNTRPILLHRIDRALLERSVHIYDPVTIAEFRTFIFHKDGKQAAAPGYHDDTIMALALGLVAYEQAAMANEQREQRRKRQLDPRNTRQGRRYGGFAEPEPEPETRFRW